MADLFQLLKFSRSGYDMAYDRAHDPRIRDLFGALASGRVLMLAELERAAAEPRFMPIPGIRLVKASLQRTWLEVLNALQLLGDQSLLSECARAERYMIHIYDRYMGIAGIDAATAEVLGRHKAILVANLADIQLVMQTSGSLA
ncbi:MAG: DUF2383 domain-containing protein [Flavobacteriales bacterium]